MILSILIPSIPSRLESHLIPLVRQLEGQIEKIRHPNEIEIIVLCDNKKRSIGAKRQALLNMAQGEYITYLDDDDVPNIDYIKRFVRAYIYGYPSERQMIFDVATFNQNVLLNGETYKVRFQHGHPTNDELIKDAITIRPPWHVCFWRREVVQHCTFPDTNYGEDWAWAEQANKKAKYAHHINHEMMTYVYDSKVSEANPE